MKNSENQKIRDREKWLESQKVGYDKAGAMDWCMSCEFSTTCQSRESGRRCDYGGVSGDYEQVPFPCATAYNRMKRLSSKKTSDWRYDFVYDSYVCCNCGKVVEEPKSLCPNCKSKMSAFVKNS